MMSEQYSICFTGHRELPKGSVARLQELLMQMIRSLSRAGHTTYYAGGARGFDMLCGICVANLKLEDPTLRLVLALPYRGHDRAWPQSERQRLQDLIARADEVHYLSQGYHQRCMTVRNRFMVDRSATCLCYLTQNTGGTASTVKYARELGKRVVNLAELLAEQPPHAQAAEEYGK